MTGYTRETSQWGTYAPRGMDKLLLLVRQLGLAHGPVKNVIARSWLTRHPDTPADITYHNIRYRLYPGDNVTDAKILFGSKNRDRVELASLTGMVGNGGIFVDVGANIGYYSLVAAAGGAARVLAIEPNPPAFARLAFHIAANDLEDRIDAVQVALGDHTGEATLYVPETGDIGGSRISEQSITGRQVRVPLVPLTELLAEHSIEHIDALKIDVEGMEDSVLFPFFENAPSNLWPRLVIIEHTSGTDWRRDILSWMLEHGYTITEKTGSNAMLQLSAPDGH